MRHFLPDLRGRSIRAVIKMKNVINILILIIVLISSTCLAMSFSQPVKMGMISGTPQGGFDIDGASYNKGTSYKNGQLDKQWAV